MLHSVLLHSSYKYLVSTANRAILETSQNLWRALYVCHNYWNPFSQYYVLGIYGKESETIPSYRISPDPSDFEVYAGGLHRFSMGFKSVDCDGKGKTLILF